MQLFLLIALLLASGKGGESFYSQVKPIFEYFGGEDAKQAVKSAEELKGVLDAFGGMGSGGNGAADFAKDGKFNGACAPDSPPNQNTHTYAPNNQNQCKNTPKYGANTEADGKQSGGACGQTPPFALAPIVRLADREIIYRLAQYFSEGAPA